MARAYSLDLRERAIGYLEEGRGVCETARIFRISCDSLERWRKLKREKRLEPLCNSKRRAKKLDSDKLKAYVLSHPDKTLMEIGEAFGASAVAVFKRIKALGISYKKK